IGQRKIFYGARSDSLPCIFIFGCSFCRERCLRRWHRLVYAGTDRQGPFRVHTKMFCVPRRAIARHGRAPALKGTQFVAQWNSKKLSELYNYVHNNMPLGVGGSVPSQEYADIVAFILAQDALPAGNEMFTPKTPMDRELELPGT